MTDKELFQALVDGRTLKNKYGGMIKLGEDGQMLEWNFVNGKWQRTELLLWQDSNKWEVNKEE